MEREEQQNYENQHHKLECQGMKKISKVKQVLNKVKCLKSKLILQEMHPAATDIKQWMKR